MPRTDSHRDGARRRPRPLSPLRRLLTRRLHIDLLRICSAASPAV
ncbi:cell envelope biogenesis protein OmpA [Streptomyces rugosispiralis]|uniref:Cell envelope biogenesis protein OmpA n=1 Tax=Streptomyces rugosispiralis TaxID=2967341 RepID=A0ABT1UU65_9ACTN|nr:cell envelope biogenesis protein OmpA [Streptomyces rugosispiralis]MCQ8188587.1 cell envelope biogenesis protein OmpA [Streptomyces rugosispiralis]